MKIPNTQIDKCISKDDVRYYLKAAHLDIEKKRLLATTGNIAVIIPVEVSDDDTSGPVTVEALKSARTGRDKSLEITCNGGLTVTNGPTFLRPDLPTFPDLDRVIPKEVDVEGVYTFNAKYLLDIAQALTEGREPPEISLHIPKDKLTAARVTKSGTERFGVIMPVRV